MTNANVAKTSEVSFHVFRKDGSKNPDITRYFLDNKTITAHDAMEGKLVLSDRTEWTLVLEPRVREALRQGDSVECLISFQARVDGNFAVARIYDPEKKLSKLVKAKR